MKLNLLLLVTALLNLQLIHAQTEGVKDYHPPLGIPLVLSSNFGELRTNHFHMGLDFKTNLKTGYKIYSIEEGYVSRIKISPYGYGKVVYIDHPNGITSVYAHCSEFKGEIDSLVKKVQHKEQNFEIEIYPEKNSLRVKKGEVIALSGNTGSSTAPHLHFELRDTETEHALNPLLFGFDIADTKAPEIRGIKVYSVDPDGYLMENRSISKLVVKGKNGYYIGADEITVTSDYCNKLGGIGFAFDVIDRLDGAPNQCGLFGSHLIIDGDTIFSQAIKRIPFESTRFINSHMDYNAFHTLRRHFHKSFRTTENDLPIYQSDKNKGIFRAQPGQSYAVSYVAYDLKGNKSVLKFTLHVKEGQINFMEHVSDGKNFLDPSGQYRYASDDCVLEMGLGTVYEPAFIENNRSCGEIFDEKLPVHQAFTVKLRSLHPNDGKSYISVNGPGLGSKYLPTRYENGWLIAESKYFGTFKEERDLNGPKVIPFNISSRTNFLSSKRLVWNISDYDSGIDDYDLFVDGQWYVVEYEYKGKTLTFDIPSDLKGNKELILVVKDKCGNTTEWTKMIEFL